MGTVDMTPEDFIHVFGLLALITYIWNLEAVSLRE